MKTIITLVLIISTLFVQAQKNAGLIPVMKNGKYGYMNLKGDTVIGLIYDGVENFPDGLSLVFQTSPSGTKHFCYVDENGKVLISCDSLKSISSIQNGDTTYRYWGVWEAGSFKHGIALLTCAGYRMPD